MTALPLLIYVLLTKRKQVYSIAAALFGGIIVSKGLFWLAAQMFNITFVGGSFVNGKIYIIGAIKSTVVLFAGSTDAGKLRVLINISILLATCFVFVWGIYKHKVPQKLWKLILVYFVCNEAVYVVSGQASQSHTSRYLIMLVPIMMLVISYTYSLIPRRISQVFLMIVVLVNLTSFIKYLSYTTNADEHVQSVGSYIKTHNISYALASMDTALPVSFYSYAPTANVSALACAAPNLVMAKSVPKANKLSLGAKEVPIILDGNNIANSPAVCNADAIKSQLGSPLRIDTTTNGSAVLYYAPQTLTTLGL